MCFVAARPFAEGNNGGRGAIKHARCFLEVPVNKCFVIY